MPALPVRRGCGSRREGGIYLEVGLGPGGSPLEAFLVDPPIVDGLPDDWLKPHRTPLRFVKDDVVHVVVWVGAEFYPNVWDFIEETRVAGVSRRVPSTFDFSGLSPASRLYFVHPHAAVDGSPIKALINADPPLAGVESDGFALCCPNRFVITGAGHDLRLGDAGSTRCLGLAHYLPTSDVHGFETTEEENGDRTRILPCGHSYRLPAVIDDVDGPLALVTRPALFLMLPLHGIALVNKNDGSFDEKAAARVSKASTPVYRVDQ